MSIFRIIFAISILLVGCKSYNSTNFTKSDTTAEQDSLSFELCKIYGSDQGIRDMHLLTSKEAGALRFSPYLDSVNFFKILDFVKKYGAPNERLLGKKNFSYECVDLAYKAVLLHTPHMLINNREYLDIFLREVEAGNMQMKTLITILDKYYWIRTDEFGNRRLLYGSQFGFPCLKYKHESDSARAVLGLPPLADSLFVVCKSQ
ncbi:hypothetical protein GCM10009122_20710 [Fulvivirga kasyanovii]|uniref:hypothetical protein n=1 Tax=Fulvivirga kasyanovii TaxID=396812 RepID=UPI0031D73574